ncbi:M1 aminopeptidase family protein [Acidicapsa ligni]|uniref:hypothetical protein n=1 Tax=Acidicapsa ligni TaxID=542300 RepID=UPI0021DF9FBF|nr:hypothetical protein [Acidicapsa ligni]
MKASIFPAAVSTMLLAVAVAIISSAHPSQAQTSTGTPPVSSQTIQQTDQDAAKKGKVLFSRSIDSNGQTVDNVNDPANPQTTPAPQNSDALKASGNLSAGQAAVKIAPQPTAEDAERAALTYTDFDLDARLRPAEGHLAVRALVTVRNDGKTPLLHIPLQLSSTLDWEIIRLNGRQMPFTQAVLNSDADHTGQLHEAAITPSAPLAPGASLQLDVTYSGIIAQSAKRLLAIGTPDDVAAHSDWDRIGIDFTGLRGFGNVVWYPVSSVPVILGDGARLFDEIGTHKLRSAGAHFRLALTVETPPGQAPNVALINGRPAALSQTLGADASVATVSTAHVDDAILGFEAPSLFLASRSSSEGPNITLWTRPESTPNIAAWNEAATEVIPFLQGWLGQRPRSQLTILDLPDPADVPFETGAMLATPIRAATPEVLDGLMAHALTHAWVLSPRAWLSEGVAHFMGTLWIEKQQGRERALATLDGSRAALTLAEPASPGEGDGQPLTACISPVYYRTKAAYVFWMLRDLVSDATLSAALRAYDPAADTKPEYFETLIEQAGQRRNLGWFFADWVYADKGLPDLSIESVFSSAASVPGSYLVAVNVANNGYVAVEAPIQVISDTASVTQRVVLQARSKTVQRILLQGIPSEVRLNDGAIPETQATIHSKLIEAATPN